MIHFLPTAVWRNRTGHGASDLVVPLISALVPAAGDALRNLPVVPSDHAWLSGTVSQAHAHFADQCERCHTTPFVPTTNAACIACHRQTPHHVEVERLEQGLFAGARCADCHHEHNGRLTIVRADEGLCVNCHGDLRAVAPDTQLHDVTHFGSDHPPFEPLRAAAEDEPGSNRAMPGLEFPHKLHVAAVGIDNADGETVTLGCADCHMPEAGGGLMAPVGFEAHCQSCHRLRIPGDSARELPHGHVAATLASLRDYFAARALAGGYTDVSAPEVVQRRRRPGVELTPAERADALAWAREQATVASREMFVFTSCGLCHQAEPTGAGGEQEWVLAPLGVPHAWLPKSRFSHGQHEAMGCDDCHADVAGSESSADVLLPEIDVCRTCHGGADARAGRLASTCITCHGFHRAKAARLSP